MEILKAYKTELDPNNKQRAFFGRCAGTSRFVYNWGLATWQQWYEAERKPSAYSLCKHFNSIKREQCSWIVELPYAVTEASFQNLGSAFKHFFRRVRNGEEKAGYPKFKRRNGNGSFQLRSTKVEGDRVRLTGIGWVRLKERAYIPTAGRHGVYATVSEHAGRWYISILAYEKIPDTLNKNTLVIGADFGVKTLVTFSNGEAIENPRYLYVAEHKLKRLQRELSRRSKGSSNWHKTKTKLARQHAKVARMRKHLLHQISHYVTTKLQPHAIVLEDLNVSGMVKNHHLAKAISDVGFSELRRQVEYKAKWNSIEIIIADRWYASSKTCSDCGWHNLNLTLADRQFCCPECGLEIDRDLNAALNLESLAA